ncbi:hypothetical protein [Streptomyces sp. AC495_CC817]|uniref:hypothetical protein n=1 Tax=Streptomyces sp. AC495_CC817 TaxID=2823900 RepID=UPI001C280BC3|nr:hypothetical protein [Streptomyces sp. AC495_CC817]
MSLFSRPRRAFWGDARFLIGIALVAASITGVWLLVSSSGRTTPVLVADRTIVRGEPLASDDFRVVDAALGPLTDAYLTPRSLRPGTVAARTLADGEIVPRAAVADAERSRTTTLVIESSTGIPDGVEAGAVVEIWQAPVIDDGRAHEAPRILVSDAIVGAVVQPEGMIAADGSSIEVVVDRTDVAAVLAAITGGALLSIVPIGSSS